MFREISDKGIFSKKVGKSREAMIEFLSNHFRYWTMNPWNRSTSYANNLKIWNVIPKELQDKAFEIMDQGDVYDEINLLIREFGEKHDWDWQVGFNGRNGGYLVLYRGGYRKEKRFRCSRCNRKNFLYSGECPYCKDEGIKIELEEFEVIQPFSYPGKSIDGDNDFEDWDWYTLKERVKLVQEFDQLCDTIVETFIYYCKNYKVKEEEIMIPKKIKVLEEIGATI